MKSWSFARSGAAMAFCAALGVAGPAFAQAVIATVNDDPITNLDVEQHEKILRVLRKPATPQTAFDDVVDTRLKLIETTKFKISPTQDQVGWAMSFPAREMKMQPQQLAAAMVHAGVSEDQIAQKYKAEAAWLMYIRALNRTLEVSEDEVRAEVQKRGGGKSVQYTLREVSFVVPNGAGAPIIQQRLKAAQELRARFTDCASGAQLVRDAPDAVIKPAFKRSTSSLPDAFKKALDSTAVGHLSQPERGQEGVTMYAVCDRADHADTDAEETIRQDLLVEHLQAVSAKKFAEVRARAVIVRK